MSEVIDLSVAVTAHDETLVAGPCMRSVELAIAAAEQNGFTVERLIGLDNATPHTEAYFSQPRFDGWAIEHYGFGDPFRVRNALVERASGKWIAFVDADDLVSENWFLNAVRVLRDAEKSSRNAIAHPELNWIFENHETVFVKPSQDDGIFSPYYFYFANYYDMMAVAPREAALSIPYGPRDLKNGFGYQDWQWNIETMAAGWQHVSVPDTIIFKRRRKNSVSEVNRDRRCLVRDLEPMAIDRVRHLAQPA